MIETKKTTINGREWQCTQWSGSKNLLMFHRVVSIVAPTFAHGVRPGVNLLTSSVDIAGAIDTLLTSLGTSNQVDTLVKDLVANVHIDGRHITGIEFDTAFAGPRLFDLGPGIKFVIETNFGDFSKLAASIMSQFADQQPRAEGPEPISAPA